MYMYTVNQFFIHEQGLRKPRSLLRIFLDVNQSLWQTDVNTCNARMWLRLKHEAFYLSQTSLSPVTREIRLSRIKVGLLLRILHEVRSYIIL